MNEPLLQVQDLAMHFPLPGCNPDGERRCVRAVDGVSLHVGKGETLGLVGESGSGKSTVGNCILRLLNPTAGSVRYKDLELTRLKGRDLACVRGRLQVVFQDPQSSLDPRMTVKKIVGSPLVVNKLCKASELEDRVLPLLREVGLGEQHLHRYPHEFSGGQRQRIGIARALITSPEFIVFDEPTSALDVSVQAQILNLIMALQRRHGYAYLFISHDLTVVRHISHRIAVMYLGAVVETAPKNELFENPRHPYTRALMASAPRPDPSLRQDLAVLEGDAPSPVNLPKGCRFHPRCPEARDICRREAPPRVEVGPGHAADCHLLA